MAPEGYFKLRRKTVAGIRSLADCLCSLRGKLYPHFGHLGIANAAS